MEEVRFDSAAPWLEPLPSNIPLSRMMPEHGDIIICQEALPQVLTCMLCRSHFAGPYVRLSRLQA